MRQTVFGFDARNVNLNWFIRTLLSYGIKVSIPFEWTGYYRKEPMPNEENNIIRLIDAICVAWDNPDYYPEFENGVLKKTHCNSFVNDVAKAVGCNDFFDPVTKQPLVADDIIRTISGSDHWQEMRCAGLAPDLMEIALKSIQMWANQGYLTIAGSTGSVLGSAHGHVTVIRPGIMKSSGKWGSVPVCANVGKEMFIGVAKAGVMKGEPVGINNAFVPMPHFWSWKGP